MFNCEDCNNNKICGKINQMNAAKSAISNVNENIKDFGVCNITCNFFANKEINKPRENPFKNINFNLRG